MRGLLPFLWWGRCKIPSPHAGRGASWTALRAPQAKAPTLNHLPVLRTQHLPLPPAYRHQSVL